MWHIHDAAGNIKQSTTASLDGLTGVTITGTPADNEVLAYDDSTSAWINQTYAEAGLAPVTLTDLADGEVLVSATGVFVNNTLAEAGIAAVGHTHVGQAEIIIAGDLTAVAHPIRLYNATGSARTITKVFLAANTAPVGAAIIADVNKGGTTLFTNQAHRPQIADGQNTGFTTDIDVAEWGDGTYLTVDIDQVGSGTAGSNLTVHIVYTQA